MPDYVTAHTIAASPRWRASRHRASECVSIMPDGSRSIFRAAASEPRSRANRAPRVAQPTKQETIRNLLMSLPTIHEEEGL